MNFVFERPFLLSSETGLLLMLFFLYVLFRWRGPFIKIFILGFQPTNVEQRDTSCRGKGSFKYKFCWQKIFELFSILLIQNNYEKENKKKKNEY